METWGSYALADFLMFSPASYYRRYELANADLWPAQLLLVVAAAALLWSLGRPPARPRAWPALLLAAAWALVAGGFLYRHYAQINLAADWFALAFLLQALLLLTAGVHRGWRQRVFAVRPAPARYPGIILLAYSLLLHPLAGLLAGRSWRGIELFGLAPDATALATLAVLLAGLRAATWPLLVIPLAWCVTSALTYLAMEQPHGALPLLLALTAFAASLVLRREGRS